MATLERMAIDYQALTLFCVDQTHKFSNLLEDIRKVEEFASANYSDFYSDIGK